jgi:Zn-dependent protease/predicted transcriptional regulator
MRQTDVFTWRTVMHAFRIGKLFGIDIRVDWSWVFIFVLMTWNLSMVFSQWHGDWPPLEQIGVAVVASTLFFGCLLAHELAHSLVAMRFGLRVRSITLFLFGGVSNIEQEPPSARAEFSTAIVGPLTSILLGVAFLVLAGVVTAVELKDVENVQTAIAQLGPLPTLLAWLGPINLVIGVFNLIPAFPLDGGRVLRSILWGLSGDLRTATLRVSAIGQAIGWFFIIAGIAISFGVKVPLFGEGVVSGLWLAFIGWFVRSAAAQASRRVAIDEAFAGHTVEELMRSEVIAVPPEMPITTLVHDFLVRSDDRALPVVTDNQFVGLISMSDLHTIPPADWPKTTVATVMRPKSSLAVATPDEPIVKALEELARRDIEQLPVLDHGRFVGMLQRRDVARWFELAWAPMNAGRSRANADRRLSASPPMAAPKTQPPQGTGHAQSG